MSDGDVGALVMKWLRDNKFHGALEKLETEMRVKNWPQRKTDRKRLRSLTFVLREYVELKQRQINRHKRLHSKKDEVGSYLNNLVRKMHMIAEDYEDFRRDVLREQEDSIFEDPIPKTSSSLVLSRPRSSSLSSSPQRSRKNQTPRKRQRYVSRQNLALPKEIPVERIDKFHANIMKNAAKIAEKITSTVQKQSQHGIVSSKKLVDNPEIVNIDDLIDMIDPDFLNDAVGAVSQDGFSNSLDAEEDRRKDTTTSTPSPNKGVFRHLFNKTKDKQVEEEGKKDEEQERKRRKTSPSIKVSTKIKEQENLLNQMDINEFVAWAHNKKKS